MFLIALITGCTSSSHLSENYSKSYNALFQAQVINTDAPKNRTPVDGMPGYEAVRIYNEIYLPSVTNQTVDGEKKQ